MFEEKKKVIKLRVSEMVSRITDNVDFGAPSQLIMEEIIGGIKGSLRDHGG